MLRRWTKYVVLVVGVLLAGCEVSGGEGEEVLSIRRLTARYEGYPMTITESVVVEGEVISTDRSDEFYNRVIIQDDTGGVVFMVDCDTLHLIHTIGDRLRVECRGLTLGGYGGGVRLGVEGVEEQVEALPLADWMWRCDNVGRSERLHITTAKIASLSAANLYTNVLLEGVRFVEAGEQWAERKESLSRHIVDPEQTTDTLVVRMSGYSEFWDARIPAGVCDVVGVVDYFGNNYQLLIASPDAVFVRE